MIVWMMAIAVSVAGMIITAAARPGNVSMAYIHLAIAACMAVFFALDGIRTINAAGKQGQPATVVAAEAVRAIGLVWIWAAIVIAATYGTGVLAWKEWVTHFAGFGLGGGLCLGVASALDGSGAAGKDDPTMMSVARILLLVHLVGTAILVVGFILDKQILRFLVERYQDWPAKNVIFFAGLAIAALAGAGLKLIPKHR